MTAYSDTLLEGQIRRQIFKDGSTLRLRVFALPRRRTRLARLVFTGLDAQPIVEVLEGAGLAPGMLVTVKRPDLEAMELENHAGADDFSVELELGLGDDGRRR